MQIDGFFASVSGGSAFDACENRANPCAVRMHTWIYQ
jgi:hypothetical protein